MELFGLLKQCYHHIAETVYNVFGSNSSKYLGPQTCSAVPVSDTKLQCFLSESHSPDL